MLKHDACRVEHLSHAPKADVEIPFQTEEDEKPQIKDKQGNVKKHKEKPKCPNGQWEGIIDHTGLKLASNIKCTNVPEMAKLQNYKIEIAKSSSVHELAVTEKMLTDARSKIASLG